LGGRSEIFSFLHIAPSGQHRIAVRVNLHGEKLIYIPGAAGYPTPCRKVGTISFETAALVPSAGNPLRQKIMTRRVRARHGNFT